MWNGGICNQVLPNDYCPRLAPHQAPQPIAPAASQPEPGPSFCPVATCVTKKKTRVKGNSKCPDTNCPAHCADAYEDAIAKGEYRPQCVPHRQKAANAHLHPAAIPVPPQPSAAPALTAGTQGPRAPPLASSLAVSIDSHRGPKRRTDLSQPMRQDWGEVAARAREATEQARSHKQEIERLHEECKKTCTLVMYFEVRLKRYLLPRISRD